MFYLAAGLCVFLLAIMSGMQAVHGLRPKQLNKLIVEKYQMAGHMHSMWHKWMTSNKIAKVMVMVMR